MEECDEKRKKERTKERERERENREPLYNCLFIRGFFSFLLCFLIRFRLLTLST